ncbi:MAG TPA: ABC transporter substrate-binding protein [Casimicrobiaceae bacterium]
MAVVAAVAIAAIQASAARAADPAKVLRIAFPAAETGFDPVRVSDTYSATVDEAIFDRLYTYDYLARPAKIVPMTAASMPEISDHGRVYVVHLKHGIHFTPDPAFGGRPRELTAEDYVYTFERFADPANRSPWAFLVQDRFVGLDREIEAAKKTGKFDYDAKIPGIEAVDRYTLRFELKRPDYLLLYTLAHTSFGAMAREVVEKYGNDLEAHPVGTGPYMLAHWRRAAKIVLVANPDYRKEVWDFESSGEAWDTAVIAAMKGKTIPQIGRVEISIIEESQSAWLAFQRGELDRLAVPATFRAQALDAENRLLPKWTSEGVKLYRMVLPSITYVALDFRDPLLAGFSKEKIALRRAIIMGYDIADDIRVLRKGQAVQAQMPIPPGVVGFDPAYRNVNQYDPELANELLDYYGYRKGPDRYRTLPDGKPLTLRMATGTTVIDRESDELWKRSMDAIGLRIVFEQGKFSDQVKGARACHLMMWGQAWSADYPDGDDFMQLLYGPNTGQSNNGCYQSKSFDSMYEKSRELPPDSPEREHLYIDMTRQAQVDGAWSLEVSPISNEMIRPWVLGYKRHPILNATFVYMDLLPHH